MSGKNSIQVGIKVRPLLKKEKDQQPLWRVVNNSIQQVDSQSDPYYFDHIFDQDATNQQIFDKMAKHIVHAAMKGFNGTIFAYGQTSSGKTYTMMGDDDNPGVMVLAAKDIFRELEQLSVHRQFLLRVGYIEIYNEKIFDLLNKKNQDLKIHETGNGLITVNCEESIITSEEDLLYHLTQGSKERTVGETNMNERSSRSHAIFRIIIESRKVDRSEDDAVIQSVLNLVDLAGSERADQTGARGTRLKEGGHINKSLLFLSNVIKRLSENEDDKFISYRDSKLTRILQDSLGGNALTAIICTIKPTAIEETQSTLSFAMRAKSIKNKPQVNETVSDATMMKRLEREVKLLRIRLAEEQKKNESQIKVRQLEQRIRNEDLKIISCNSLHRNREKRRRTWCPSSNLNTSNIPSALPVPTALPTPSALPVPSFHNGSNNGGAMPPSRLQPPKAFYFTPLITCRPTEPPPAPKLSTEEMITELDEEFAPAEMINFDRLSPLLTPKTNMPRSSMTPKVTSNSKLALKSIEQDLMELQSFTNLEDRCEVQHETDLSLKQMVNSLTNRISLLESERIEYIQLKDEITITREHLTEYETKCDALQIQISKLTSANKSANDKIAKYELELAELKKTNEKLEMENREAVNIEFEFDRHKNKSKLRENELLEALKEKEREVNQLEKSLKTLTSEKFTNSKEELLQLSLTESNIDENGKICVKCEDLQRLLADNEKVTQEFTKLTLEYEQLRINYQEIEKENQESKLKIEELEELQKRERNECELLQRDLQLLREKLQDIQKEYEQVSSENSAKSEECMALNHQVELARQEMVVLQEKYNSLELSWQEQQKTLKDIEQQYAEIENKYKNLQLEYEELERSSSGKEQSSITASVTDCERLQKENLELQSEIVELKHKVQDVQQQLLERGAPGDKERQETDVQEEVVSSSGTANLVKENEQLKSQLLDLQTQFDDLQREYDDLSNQLMDNLQESDTLKEQNLKLQEEVKALQQNSSEVSKAEAQICELKSQLEKVLGHERRSMLCTPSPGRNSSMRSSGVCIEEEYGEFEGSPCPEDELLKKFQQLSESLTQIELEQQNGQRRIFKTPKTQGGVGAQLTPNYKLYLRNISGVNRIQKSFLEEMENVQLQGSFKQHSFHIVELNEKQEGEQEKNEKEEENGEKENVNGGENGKANNCDGEIDGCENCMDFIVRLKEQISQLRSLNEEERQSNKALLENTERTLSEMREQITQLSAELLEKSIFVEKCACKTYQQQIETLEKEKADMTVVFEELQEKVNNCTFDSSMLMMNCTLNGEIAKPLIPPPPINDLRRELENLQAKEREMAETLDSQTSMLEDLTQRNLDLESDMKAAQDLFDEKEKQYKERCQQLQLEMMEKLEMSANEYRDNIKKYNAEWENRKDAYEATIKEQEEQLQKLQQENEEISRQAQELQEQMEKVKNEYNQLQSEYVQSKEEGQGEQAENQELQQLRTQYNELQSQHEQILSQLKGAEQTCHTVREELQHLTHNFEEIQAQRLQLQEQCRQQEQALREFQEEQQNSQEMAKLQEEYKQIQLQLQQALEEMKEKEDICEKSQKELQDEKEKLIKLQEEKEAKEKDYENLQDQRQQLQMEYDKALETLQANEESSNTLGQELQEIKQNFATLQAQYFEMEEQQKTSEEIRKDLEALKEKEATLLKEKEVLDKELLQLREDYRALNEQHNEIVKEKMEIADEKEEIQQKLSQLQAALSSNEAQQEVLKQISEEKDQLALERQQILQKLQQAEMQIQDLCKEDSAREEIIKTFQEKIATLEAVQNEKEDAEKQKTELSCQLQSLNEEKENLEKELVELKETKESGEKLSEMHLNTLREEKITLEEQKFQLEEQLKNLQSVAEEKASLEERVSQLTELENKKATLEENLQMLMEEKSSMESNLSELTEDKRLLAEKLQDLSALQEEKLSLESQLKDLKEEKSLTEEKLKSLEIIVEEKSLLEKQKSELEEKLQILESVMEEKSSLESKVTELYELQKQKLLLEENLKTLETSSEAEKKALEEQIQEIEKQYKEELQEKQKTIDELLETKKAQEAEKLGLQEQLKSLEEQLQQHQAEKEQLQQDLQDLNSQITQKNEELNTFKERETDHLKAYEDLQAQLNTLTTTSASLELEKCNLEQNLQKCNDELQKLRNDSGILETQLSQITEEKKSLSEKCSLLSEEITTLKKQLLCLKEKEKAEELLEQMIQEKAELTQNLRLTNEKYEAKQQEFLNLQQQFETNNHQMELLKTSLINASKENETLERELQQYQELSAEKAKLEASLIDLRNANSEKLCALQQEKDTMQITLTKYERDISQYKQQENTFTQKLERLSQELHETRSKAKSYEALLQEHEEVERSLNQISQKNSELTNEIKNLKSLAQQHEETSNKQTEQIHELETKLMQASHVEKELRSQLNSLQQQLQSSQSSLQHETVELKNSLGELQLKYTSLQTTNEQLQIVNKQLEQQVCEANLKLQEAAVLQNQITVLKADYLEMQRKMEATVEEAGRCSRNLRDDLQHHKELLERQLESYNTLRTEMTTKKRAFEEEKQQLTTTIETLQATTASLEGKIREITINNLNMDRQNLNISGNTSMDFVNTSSNSPRPRKSLDASDISGKRKNRRLSTFDERRCGIEQEKGTMTDPQEPCKCEELDRKLKECERNLFIRESQVTALSMELKNHPLKDEKAALMKRLQEEQEKMKRYKQKIYEQTQKTEKAMAALEKAQAQLQQQAAAAQSSSAEKKTTASSETVATPVIVVPDTTDVETQTDGDISTSFNALQGKYNDLINICRYRKDRIKELEERISQKENTDGNSMNTLEATQMKMLKSQCDSMKKELNLLREKYENAKIVLHTRREEIQRLRSQLGQ
ncbi:centromere-associated protein E [Musca vetustissima]|uniref:centromere-associated protein E n=1 Tax=Musca vetustissima TaxID=27455 RepID=UPI002AB66F6F|nr:centromere-associated protein E [Musca vetustissima]